MIAEHDQLIALQTFQQKLATVASWAEITNLVETFLLNWLGPTLQVTIAPEGEMPPTTLSVPLASSQQLLHLTREDGFEASEIAFAELVANTVAYSATFQSYAPEKQAQRSLLHTVSQVITSQQGVIGFYDVLQQEFPMAFPRAMIRFYVRESNRQDWELHGQVGPSLAVDMVIEQEPAGFSLDTLQQGDIYHRPDNDPPRLLIPIYVGEKVVGYGDIIYTYPLTPNDIQLLETIVGYLGIALSNRNLIQNIGQRVQQIETIYHVTESARYLKPLLPTLEEIHHQVSLAFNAPICYLALYEVSTQTVHSPFATLNYEPQEIEPVSVFDANSLAAWVIRTNEPYFTTNWTEDESVPVTGRLFGPHPASLMIYPMQVKDEVVGALSIQNPEPNAFDEADFRLLGAIAGHVAVIVDNARLYEQRERQFRTAEALQKAAAIVSTSLELNIVFDHLLGALSQIITYDFVSIALLEDGCLRLYAYRTNENEPITTTNTRIPLDQHPLLQDIIQCKETILVEDTEQDNRWVTIPGNEQTRSWIGAPLIVSESVTGILMVMNHEPYTYTAHERWLISTLASHAAIAAQNAQLHSEIQQQLSELTILHEASATMTADLDLGLVLQTVVKEMVQALDVDSCTIFVRRHPHDSLQMAAHENQSNQPTGLSLLKNLESYTTVGYVCLTKDPYIIHEADHPNEDEAALLEAAGLKSLLLVPLTRRDQILGLLAMGQIDSPREFSEREVRLVRNLGSQATVAIEHARLYNQAQRRVHELSAFQRIALQINTPLDLTTLLDTITEAALKLVDANNLHIYLYDPEIDDFEFGSALWRDGRREAAVKKIRPNGLTATVVKMGKPVIINDAQNHPLYQSESAKQWGVQAIAGFPLKRSEHVIGAFTVTYLVPHIFTDDELLLLNLLADQAAVAVENARLFNDVQRQLSGMSALVDMAKQVTGNLKLQLVMDTTVNLLRDLLEARASTIAVLHDEELVIEAAAGIKPEFLRARMKLGVGVSSQAVVENRPVYVRDTYSDPDFFFFDRSVRSILTMPLASRDQVIGTLTVDSDRPDAFSDNDIQIMTIAAAQVSVAIANARLFEEAEHRAAQLAVAYEELKEHDRLKDELVQNVSHELRTPLTFVKGYVDLMLDGEMGALVTRQQDALRIVADKTDVITRLIDDIVTIQRIETGNLILESFSMAELIETAVECHHLTAANQGLHLKFEPAGSLGAITGDKGRINQVLDNLINNAMKFSPNGGTILLTMRENALEVEIMVADNGIGIPPDKVERIFDRFYQIDGSSRRRFGGTGIGLAIVKRIIDAHYGRIWVESAVNKGSTFHVVLPKNVKTPTNKAGLTA